MNVYTLQHDNFRCTGLTIQLSRRKEYIYIYIYIYVYQVCLGKNENSEKCQESEDKWVRSITMMGIIAFIKEALDEVKTYNQCPSSGFGLQGAKVVV